MSIADDLNRFSHLQHLYFEEYDTEDSELRAGNRRDIFASQAKNLAEVVPGLITITNVTSLYQPYMVARITRGENEQVSSVEVGNGYGMKIGYEDEAFPWAPHDNSDL